MTWSPPFSPHLSLHPPLRHVLQTVLEVLLPRLGSSFHRSSLHYLLTTTGQTLNATKATSAAPSADNESSVKEFQASVSNLHPYYFSHAVVHVLSFNIRE